MKAAARNVVILAVIVLNVAALFGANVSPNLVIALCFAGFILST